MTLLKHADKWLATNPLHSLPTAKAQKTSTGIEYDVKMQEIRHSFHPHLPEVRMWSYGSTHGLILEAQVGVPVRVNWFNGLLNQSLKKLLDFGDRLGMEEAHMLEITHNVVHLHGARVPWTSDGFPEHIYHPPESHSFYYPNEQAASTLWFHDHAMNVTRLNVYAGLFGVYLLRTAEEATMLPAGDELELTLLLQDKSFSPDGKKLHYEQTVEFAGDPGNRSVNATPEFVGDYPVVNGQVWPLKKLRPRIYRFRFVNGANTRFFNLSLATGHGTPLHLWVIGTDGGFLEKAVPTSPLLIAPGERVDVLVDLRAMAGESFILRNDAPAPYSGDPHDLKHYGNATYKPLAPTDHCAELLKIVVEGEPVEGDKQFDPAKITLPQRVNPLPRGPKPPLPPPIPIRDTFPAFEAAIAAVPIHVREADLVANEIPFKLRRLKLEEYQLPMDTFPGIRVPSVQIDGKVWDNAPPLVTTKNALEVWEFVNVTPDTHPMHIHLIQFQVMSRTFIEVVDDPSRLSPDLTEPKRAKSYLEPALVEPFEMGWKDTVRCNPQQSTRVMVQFDGYVGDYVYHCHILEHEDMGMMYKLNVEPPKSPA